MGDCRKLLTHIKNVLYSFLLLKLSFLHIIKTPHKSKIESTIFITIFSVTLKITIDDIIEKNTFNE